MVTATFAGSLDRRFTDLIPDLPFPDTFRIPKVAAFLNPTPERGRTFADNFGVFSDLDPTVGHKLSDIG
jgi:hypothetical protein